MNQELKLITGSNYPIVANTAFDRVIGQEAALKKLRFYIESHSVADPVPTMLFTGSHGLGKTYVAEKVAKSMGRRFVEVNSSLIKDNKQLVEEVLLQHVLGDTPVTLFFDEAHALNSEVTNTLLTLLNSENTENSISYKGWNIVHSMVNINTIFATTDAYKIFAPLRNRCERIYFESYEKKDLLAMLAMYCPGAIFMCHQGELSEACRSRGRDTFSLAGKINRHLKREAEKVLTPELWQSLKDVFEIYPRGLNRQEVELLQIIGKNGPISAANIALTMMVNVDNIESEMEVRPRELSLIKSTTRGRVLTDEGQEYVEALS